MNITMSPSAVPTSSGFSPAPCRSASPPGMAASVLTIAWRELRDAVTSRWFILYTIAFAALGLGISYVSAVSAGGAGLSGFARTSAGLTNLVLLVVPLMALSAGAGSIASDRERGMLSYMLAQPVRRFELVLGKFLGLALALLACLSLGLGACAAVLALKGVATSPASILWLAGLSFLLSLGMLSLGMLVSVLARKASVAIGTAIFIWLTLVFVTDLGLMAGAVALRLPIGDLFALSLLNPLQVFKMWALHAADASLDVLGPAGLYAMDEYGSRLHALFAACLGAWIVGPLALASMVFARRSPL
ncbi:MAG: ABC transporter permease [Phycisphaerales bacterium]